MMPLHVSITLNQTVGIAFDLSTNFPIAGPSTCVIEIKHPKKTATIKSGAHGKFKMALINAGGDIKDGNFTIVLPPGISYVSSGSLPKSVGSPRLQDQTLLWEGLEIKSQESVKFSLTLSTTSSISGPQKIVSFFTDTNTHCIFGPHITEVSSSIQIFFEIPMFLHLFSTLTPPLPCATLMTIYFSNTPGNHQARLEEIVDESIGMKAFFSWRPAKISLLSVQYRIFIGW